jgi:hypothetical protein
MHHEILRVDRFVKVLQQKTAVAVMKVRYPAFIRYHREANILIKFFGPIKIYRGYKSFDFYGR